MAIAVEDPESKLRQVVRREDIQAMPLGRGRFLRSHFEPGERRLDVNSRRTLMSVETKLREHEIEFAKSASRLGRKVEDVDAKVAGGHEAREAKFRLVVGGTEFVARVIGSGIGSGAERLEVEARVESNRVGTMCAREAKTQEGLW